MRKTSSLRSVLGTVAFLSGLVASQACDSALELPFWEEEHCKASIVIFCVLSSAERSEASLHVKISRIFALLASLLLSHFFTINFSLYRHGLIY